MSKIRKGCFIGRNLFEMSYFLHPEKSRAMWCWTDWGVLDWNISAAE